MTAIRLLSHADVDVVLWRRIGATALRLGDRQLARHAYEQGLKRSPTNWLCLQDLSSLLMDMGDYEASLAVTERLVWL